MDFAEILREQWPRYLEQARRPIPSRAWAAVEAALSCHTEHRGGQQFGVNAPTQDLREQLKDAEKQEKNPPKEQRFLLEFRKLLGEKKESTTRVTILESSCKIISTCRKMNRIGHELCDCLGSLQPLERRIRWTP